MGLNEISASELVSRCTEQEPIFGWFLLGVGLMFLFLGLRMSRILIMLSFTAAGFVLGMSLDPGSPIRFLIGTAFGITFMLTSWCTPRPSTATLVGIWAGILGMIAARIIGGTMIEPHIQFTFGAILFMTGAALSMVMPEAMVAFITSLEGTLIFVCGLVIVITGAGIPTFAMHMKEFLTHPISGPFAVAAGTFIGCYTQLGEMNKKNTGRSA